MKLTQKIISFPAQAFLKVVTISILCNEFDRKTITAHEKP